MQIAGLYSELLIVLLILVALVIIYYLMRFNKDKKTSKDSYISALEYLADNEYKWAIHKFKEAVKDDSENIHAYLRLGDLLREKGLIKNALKIHKDLTLRSNLSLDFRLKIQHSLLLDYDAIADTDAAIKVAYNLLESDNAFYKEASTKLIQYLENENRWEEAFNAVKKYIKPLSIFYEKRLALYRVLEGLQLQEKNQGRDGRLKFKEAIKIDPQSVSAYYYLGKSYYLEERLEDASREWQNLCKSIPDKAYVVFEALERTWFDLGKFAEAEKLYNSLLTKDPNNIHAGIGLAAIYNKKGEYDRALEILDRIQGEQKSNSTINSFRVLFLYNKNQYKQAGALAVEVLNNLNQYSEYKFICQDCNYKSNEPLWVCPQCKSISTFNI